MAKIIKYIPQRTEIAEKFPVVIGLPGFVGMLDGGRIEGILKELNNCGIAGCGVLYDGIDEERADERDKKVVCNFNLEAYIKNVEESFERIAEDERLDIERVGVLASSISGCVFAYALANNRLNGIAPKAYASISPWTGYEAYKTAKERQGLEMAIREGIISEIPIRSKLDDDRKIVRVIPASCAPELKKLASVSELREKYKNKKMEVMTILGNKDTTCSPEAMMEYHRALYGEDKDLIVFDGEEHNIPFERIVEPTMRFFVKTMLREKAA